MIRALFVAAVVAVCTTSIGPLFAQEREGQQPQARPDKQGQPAEFGDPRFAFHRVEDGYLRLDLRSGDVAACRQRAAVWACTLVPDERAAVDNEIARLQRDNANLKTALLEHGVPLPGGGPSEAAATPAPTVPPVASLPPAGPPSASAPPSLPPKAGDPGHASRDDAEIDRIMRIFDKVWRRLVEMMSDIQRDMQKKS